MPTPDRHSGPDHVALLQRIAARIRAGENPTQAQIEETLEQGFGQLMGLQAELMRARRRRQEKPATNGHRPDVTLAPSATQDDDVDIEHLEEAVDVLGEALGALRRLSGPPGPPRIAYGFVLPPRPAD